MGIPTLPKHEVPEVGYRLIRDELINLFGDELDAERSASEQVIERLREFKELTGEVITAAQTLGEYADDEEHIRRCHHDAEGPYRERIGTIERLDDHEGRIEVMEHILDGRVECSGDVAIDQVEKLHGTVRLMHYQLIVLLAAFVITIFGGLFFLEKLHEENLDHINDNDHKLQRVEHQLKELRVQGYKILETVERP